MSMTPGPPDASTSLPAGVAEVAGRRPRDARLVGEREALPHHRALRDVADGDVEEGLLRRDVPAVLEDRQVDEARVHLAVRRIDVAGADDRLLTQRAGELVGVDADARHVVHSRGVRAEARVLHRGDDGIVQ